MFRMRWFTKGQCLSVKFYSLANIPCISLQPKSCEHCDCQIVQRLQTIRMRWFTKGQASLWSSMASSTSLASPCCLDLVRTALARLLSELPRLGPGDSQSASASLWSSMASSISLIFPCSSNLDSTALARPLRVELIWMKWKTKCQCLSVEIYGIIHVPCISIPLKSCLDCNRQIVQRLQMMRMRRPTKGQCFSVEFNGLINIPYISLLVKSC
ncbi:hypothetical protein K438DRAFT_2180774, partial [Mycena galopus ATCC 62051]